MVLACALLFSCATDNGAESSAVEITLPSVSVEQEETEKTFIAAALSDDPIIGKWAAKYVFAQNPQFNGIPLITDNAAFADIPADVKARKDAAEALEEQNRFLDAWYAYGEDDNEYIVALKIMCLIDDWTDTIMHQGFLLSNLEPGQDLYEYRESVDQQGEVIFYDPVEQAKKWASEHCNGVMPHILEMALGCYYQSAAMTFEDEWIIPLEDTYELSVEYFKKAITAGVYNDYSLFKAVDAFLAAGYFNEGLELIHCLELGEPDYCFHFYQEARAYMCKGEYQNALPCAARAILCSTIPEDVTEAAQVMADGFMYDSTDVESALAVLETARPYMNEYFFMGPNFMCLDILMFAKNRYPAADYDGKIIRVLNDSFAWEYHDGNYLYELTDYFYNWGYTEFGIEWLEMSCKEYGWDPLASGNLNFELGQFYLQVGDYQGALDCFNLAEKKLTEAGVYDAATSNIPYYQKLCREQLLGTPNKNKA